MISAHQDIRLTLTRKCWNVLWQRALGIANNRRGIGTIQCFSQFLTQRDTIARSGQPQSGNHLQHGHVPHAVMTRSIISRHTGAIEDEGDSGLVKGRVHQDLIESTVEEGGVHRNDGMQPTHGHSRC